MRNIIVIVVIAKVDHCSCQYGKLLTTNLSLKKGMYKFVRFIDERLAEAAHRPYCLLWTPICVYTTKHHVASKLCQLRIRPKNSHTPKKAKSPLLI